MGIYPLWHLPSTFGVSWVQAPAAVTPPFCWGGLRWILCWHPDSRGGLGQAANAWQKGRKAFVGGIVLWKCTGLFPGCGDEEKQGRERAAGSGGAAGTAGCARLLLLLLHGQELILFGELQSGQEFILFGELQSNNLAEQTAGDKIGP